MVTTVAAIAAEAFTDVAAELDVIKACTVTAVTQGAYNPVTHTYAETTTVETGRAVMDQAKPIKDVFPDYVVGPGDTLFWLEGLTTAPKENNTLTIGGVPRKITQVGDVAGAGTFFSVVAR
ncbi:MAG: hypothetical protein OEM91_05025 [Hyphomicrobiales bacterium]|nr:hypothetical protein [Hyphomicrobiales bacterium]